MDAENLDFEDGTFDSVYSFGVLHHVPDAARAFREVKRVLVPGGLFIGALYNRRSFSYAARRVERLVSLGFLRESRADHDARIEYSTGDAKPYVRLFTRTELRRELEGAGFEQVGLVRRHAGFGRYSPRVPDPIERLVARRAGWYLVHAAR